MYDSTDAIKAHIKTVRGLIEEVRGNLMLRQMAHDASKLIEPEKSMHDEYTPKLKASTYGSDEYRGFLIQMGTALQHHYDNNSHHPEHWFNGISGMSLLDLIEMLADWKAASLRHANGDIFESLRINKERFQISDQLIEILENTIREMVRTSAELNK